MDCILIFPPKSFTTLPQYFFQEVKAWNDSNLWRTFCSALSLLFFASLSLLLACRAAQAFELWLQQSGGVSPSRFFRKTSAPRVRKSLRRPHFNEQQQGISEQFLKVALQSSCFWLKVFCLPPLGGKNLRDTVQTIFSSSNVQRRVTVDVDGLQITVSVQEQLWDVHTARECCPVKADVLFLRHKTS